MYAVMLQTVAVLPAVTPRPTGSPVAESAGLSLALVASVSCIAALLAVGTTCGLVRQTRVWRERARVDALREKGLLGGVVPGGNFPRLLFMS
jgi:hypothetical protein